MTWVTLWPSALVSLNGSLFNRPDRSSGACFGYEPGRHVRWCRRCTSPIITRRRPLLISRVNETLDRLKTGLAGRYTIDRELGRGGMAVVYLARDERHQRLIALKVMLPEVVGEIGAERFRREIQIAAGLTHPHIVTVFDSGDVDGLFYYAMPYVQGESLDDAIVRAKQLSIAEAVSITCHVAEALDYAHAAGVVHRDIKPANILLAHGRPRTGGGTPGRTPVVTDFGIARAMSGDGAARLTSTGLMIGTPTYMSPEQWGGDDHVDGRSDQYSLACVLYEMLIGEPPFSGATPMVVLARHTREMVPSLRLARPTVPEGLEQAVFRAMSKVPADRFDSMADFADALTASMEGGISYGTSDHPVASTTGQLPVRVATDRNLGRSQELVGTAVISTGDQKAAVKRGLQRRRVVAGIASLATMATMGGGLFAWQKLRTPPPPAKTRLLVLPFRNTGQIGDSTFADGLTEEIISRLSGVPRLGVVARTSAMKYKDSPKTLRELGTELDVTKFVQGTVRWRGGDARQATVSVQIVSLPGEVEEPVVDDLDASNLDDMYGIANQVAAKLAVEMKDTERARLLEKPTESREAYEAYQQGNRFYNHSWERGDVEASIASYELATQRDPRFALAFAALGRVYGWKYQLRYDPSGASLVLAQRAIDSAMRLSPDLPEAHLARGLFHYWGKRDYESALAEFEIVRRGLPSSAEVYNFIGNINRRKGALPQAQESYRLSAELDPASHQTLFNRAEVMLYLRDFGESERLTDKVMAIAPDFMDAYLLKAALQIHRLGDVNGARRTVAATVEKFAPESWRPIGHLWRAGLFRIIDDSLSVAERRIKVNSFGLDSGQYILSKAELYTRFAQPTRAAIYYDSAATVMDLTVKRHPEWPHAFGQLGLAYAGLNRKDEAVRAAEHETTDALDGPKWVTNMAQIYATLGDVDKAIEWLTRAMQIPSRLSPKWIELDPAWAPLRRDPRFQKLIAQPPPLRTTRASAR
jgi:eukaryotic-like serine/threonine-protein kinase